MAYFIRILSPSEKLAEPRALSTAIANHGCQLTGDGSADDWQELEAINSLGETFFILERNPVTDGSLAQEEIAEFDADIANCLPKSGSDWLRRYLTSVKTIYAFHVLNAVERDTGWAALDETKNTLRRAVGGIFQADGEGFSNEEGYHVLWQFPENVSGDWWMAVLEDGEWQKFEIDLGNPSHRDAFKRGMIPTGTIRAP